MFHDFRFGLGKVTTLLTYYCLKCIFHTKNCIISEHYTMLAQALSFSMWKRHLGHWYVKFVVTIPRRNLKP